MKEKRKNIDKMSKAGFGIILLAYMSTMVLANEVTMIKPNQEINQTVAGKLESPYPTFENLTLEWYIEGDENLDGRVEVAFRKLGSKKWRLGMDLRRVPAGSNFNYSWENRHSGSIFNLTPGTQYEIKVKLSDPDGGNETRQIVAATKNFPTYDSSARIIELEPGSYDTLVTESGTKGSPTIYKCSKGTATFRFIDMKDRKWVFLDGLKVYNIFEIDESVGIDLVGASNCVIKNCNIHAVYGIVADNPGAKECWITNNTIRGIVGWTDEQTGAHGNNVGEGIQVSGPGNVISYNEVYGFRDAISTLEGRRSYDQRCIDIHNNEIYRNGDDGIEADFCLSNCRIYENRITNTYVGLSSQPGLGGPTYFIRNSMYNIVHSAFKLKNGSKGDVVLHNTVVRIGDGMGGNEAMDFAYFRNNLSIGGEVGETWWGGWGAGRPFGADIIDPGAHSDFDYDAVGVAGGVPFNAEIGGQAFLDVEPHGVININIDSTFYNVDFPYPPFPERRVMDLRLKRESKAVDAGIYIPNINDGFVGDAPDCGAYELNQALPRYGPSNKIEN